MQDFRPLAGEARLLIPDSAHDGDAIHHEPRPSQAKDRSTLFAVDPREARDGPAQRAIWPKVAARIG